MSVPSTRVDGIRTEAAAARTPASPLPAPCALTLPGDVLGEASRGSSTERLKVLRWYSFVFVCYRVSV